MSALTLEETQAKPPLKVISLQVENIMGVRAVELRPGDGESLLVIGGDNGAGKSSTIDSLWWAIGGKPDVKDPIRRGEDQASIRLDLGDLVVTRRFKRTATGYTTDLTVKNGEGASYSSPQRLLDNLISKFAFDPFEFTRMKEKDQEELVRRVLHLDTTEIDERYKKAYEQRTIVHAELDRLKARNQGIVYDEEAPDHEVDISLLMAELQEIQAHNDKAALATADAERASTRLEQATEWIENQRAEVERLRETLKAAEVKLAEYQEKMPLLEAGLKAAKAECDKLQPKDTTALQGRISGAEEVNRRVRQNLQLAAAKEEWQTAENRRAELERTIKACADDKKALTGRAVKEAKLAIEGLELTDDGLTLAGIPFGQCNTAEKLKLSVALAVKENPRLRVYRIADGEKLTPPNMEILRSIAEDAGALILVEFALTPADVASGYRDVSVLIEDGALIAKPQLEAAS